jgi:hypothetical protein
MKLEIEKKLEFEPQDREVFILSFKFSSLPCLPKNNCI